MSYILDALKRADAERERGAVPGLHTRQSALPAGRLAPARRPGAWPWLLGGVVLAFGAGGGWWWGTSARTTTPTAASAAPGPLPAPVAAAPLVAASASGLLATPLLAASTAAPAPTSVPVPPPATLPEPPAPAATDPANRVAAASPGGLAGTRAPRPAEPGAAQATLHSDNPKRVPTLEELPPDIQAQLPPLSISGSTYSSDPARRMLIVQGQVFHEGDRIGPDLTLERIDPTAAVLEFRGHRYQMAR